MHKVNVDFSEDLEWRQGYTGETLMSYGGRRIDRYQTGGGRDSSETGSGPRSVMSGKFSAGELQPLYPTARMLLNGVEQDYIDSDWGVFVSGGGEQIITDVVENKYSMDDHIVIVHRSAMDRNLISATVIPKMLKHHASYGFDMHLHESMRGRLEPGEMIMGGTRMTNTAATMPDGNLGHGREANYVNISSFSTNEDTCAVLDTVTEDFATVGIEEVSIPIDNDHVPLGIMREDGSHVAIPRVGDIIQDGRLMSVRGRNRQMYFAHRTKKNMNKPRHPLDTTYFCKRGAEVIGVEVIRATTSKIMNHYLPSDIVTYLDDAATKNQAFWHTIMQLDKKYATEARQSGGTYKRDPSWSILVTQATKALYGPKLKQYYPNGYGKHKEVRGSIEDGIITGYLVNIKLRTIIKPHLGHKFNDQFGAKYIISEIRSKERMYKDEWGRVAEFATNGVANINRGIYGRLNSQYRTDALFHLHRNMKDINEREGFDAAKEYYLDGIRVISDKTSWKLGKLNQTVLDAHVKYVLEQAPFIQVEDEIGDESRNITGDGKIFDSKFRPPVGRLRFTDYRGRERLTACPIRIGSMYISINEKIGSSFNACNIPMRQQSGINRKLSSIDKKTSQISGQANRAYSEADYRMLADSQSRENNRRILRDGTSQSALTETIRHVIDGAMVPDIDIEHSDSRGMEILKAEFAADGVVLTNQPRHIRWETDPMPGRD